MKKLWLVLWRPLPEKAPNFWTMLAQLILALAIYDAIFFCLHLAMHKLPYFAKMHAKHHYHGPIDCNVTNQMDIPERLAIVLSVD